ncbi:anti-sigma factor family protein [Myceligenerans pegani]|uniref:Zf-HC2 domain-containing protein n=1 Tax=Myceligenerans pegani TaxID=2776917 RepID=A0ABR9N144_9MICO|nr:zf-HC2 domain-containing protein [Myceligenerans sp. TRM 65318]MBE1877378.1 zf-HC2 domain-containing protein [Myceligenerans sp. TRM 65318]MBE3019649.1 zf-HC2 domain-containing protein [Myceligenerans sp. TRM 65318]
MMPGPERNGGDRYAEWDAAYVLGALSPSDRHAYERHLAECDMCRTAVAELAGMPGLLGTVPAAQAEALGTEAPGATAPSDGFPTAAHDAGHDGGPATVVPLASLARAARRSRFRRRALTAVAASVLVVAGAVGGSVLTGVGPLGTPGGADTTPPVTAANARTVELLPVGEADMRARVVVTPTDWGTKFQWSCHYPPRPGQDQAPGGYDAPQEPIEYELVLVGRDGARTVAATWTWSGGTTTGLDASSAVPVTDMDRIEITLGGQEEALAAATL